MDKKVLWKRKSEESKGGRQLKNRQSKLVSLISSLRKKKSEPSVDKKALSFKKSPAFRQTNRNNPLERIKELFLKKGFIGFFMLLIIIILSTLIFTSDIFTVKKINIYGINQLPETTINMSLDKFRGNNILLLSRDEIKASVNSSSVYLKEVYVEKSPPDQIDVYIVERFPEAVIINYQGAFLVDQEGLVVETISKTEGFDIKKEELELLNGFGKIDSKIVIDSILNEIPEDDRAEFDVATITNEQKNTRYQELLNNIRQRVELLFEQNSKAVSSSPYANLRRVYMNSNDGLDVGAKVDDKFISVSNEVESYFRKFEELTLNRVLWEDSFSINYSTVEGKSFLFSDRRDIWRQTQDLDDMINYLALNSIDYSQIDVRSEVISVK